MDKLEKEMEQWEAVKIIIRSIIDLNEVNWWDFLSSMNAIIVYLSMMGYTKSTQECKKAMQDNLKFVLPRMGSVYGTKAKD